MRKIIITGLLCLLPMTSFSLAHEHHNKAGSAAEHSVTHADLTIKNAWARATVQGQKNASAYMTISNSNAQEDQLISVKSSSAARTEIHSMEVVNDVMIMRPVTDGLTIPANGSIELAPSGFHIMFLDIEAPFTENTKIPLTLTFKHAGSVELELPVKSATSAKGSDHHDHDHDHHDSGNQH